MKTIYFKAIIQKTIEGKSIMVCVIPDDMIDKNLPTICEVEAFKMPATVYTGTYPTIKINTDTIKKRDDLIGLGIAGILTSEQWFNETVISKDKLGISIDPPTTL